MEDTEVTLLEEDEQPSSGVWVDTCDLFEDLGADGSLETDIPEPVAGIQTLMVDPAKARAIDKATELKKIMLKHGVPEVSIELLPGRPSSYGVWDAGFFVADMSHHTVSRYSPNSLTPVLALCRNGRSDLPGPLCNGYGGWDLTYRIITFGYANHPGYGGPHTVPALTAGSFTIPKDSARRYAWGTEWEGGLNEGDWDKVLTNPRNGKKMTMREFMGRSNLALEEFLEIHPNAHMEHSTWTSRKIDRLNYTAAEGIAEKNKYRKKEPVKNGPRVDLSNMQTLFRNFILDKKKNYKASPGLKHIQKALNARYNAGLKVDGRIGSSTVKAWRAHEKRVGVVGRSGVPDSATLSALAGKRFWVGA